MTPSVPSPTGPRPIPLRRCVGWCGYVELQTSRRREAVCCGLPMQAFAQRIRTSSRRMVRMPDAEGEE